MSNPNRWLKRPIDNPQCHRSSAIAARGLDDGVAPEHGRNSHHIPDTVPVIGLPVYLREKGSGHSGKRICHQDFARVPLQDEHMGVGEAAEGCLDFRWVSLRGPPLSQR